MIKVIEGNILSTKEGIIVQQVNCQGKMGAGLALQIKNKYPEAYTSYLAFISYAQMEGLELLGQANIVFVLPDLAVANVFGQKYYGRNGVYTDYNALEKSLKKVKQFAIKNGLTVYIPLGIGCGLAGGKWEIVSNIIYKVFKDEDVNCVLIRYNK